MRKTENSESLNEMRARHLAEMKLLKETHQTQVQNLKRDLRLEVLALKDEKRSSRKKRQPQRVSNAISIEKKRALRSELKILQSRKKALTRECNFQISKLFIYESSEKTKIKKSLTISKS